MTVVNLPHLVVLGALEHLERGSGYDVERFLSEQLVLGWAEIKRTSIYHAVKVLERGGLIEPVETQQQKGYPEKKIYVVTALGRERFDELQRKAALGLFPRYCGFQLALRLNKRATTAQLLELGRAALERLGELERRMDAHLRTVTDPAQRDLDAFFLSHERGLVAAERAWIEAALTRLGE